MNRGKIVSMYAGLNSYKALIKVNGTHKYRMQMCPIRTNDYQNNDNLKKIIFVFIINNYAGLYF